MQSHRRSHSRPRPADRVRPADAAKFFIVVDGQDAKVYNPDDPPAIVTTKGVSRGLDNRESHVRGA